MEISKENLLRDLNPNSPGHQSLLEYIAEDNSYIAEFELSEEQFHLLDNIPLDIREIEFEALQLANIELLRYLKTRGQLGCNLQDKVGNVENIVTVYNPNANYFSMINQGFIPCPFVNEVKGKNYREMVEYYIQGLSDEDIRFWTGIKDPISMLSKCAFWSVVTMAFLKESCSRGDSYPVLFFKVDLLYKSMRPKTDMSMFQTANSNYYKDSNGIIDDKISVTRYAQGMSRGLFFGDRPSDTCGYFYYYEPESTTYLTYKNALVAFNKTDAAKQLIAELSEDDQDLVIAFEKYMNDRKVSNYFNFHTNGLLPSNLMLTPEQYYKIIGKTTNNESNQKVYVGKLLNLYAKEDDLDQRICVLANYLKYDIVILTHMIGSHQVVTEVLDTRHDSFSHLWFRQ